MILREKKIKKTLKFHLKLMRKYIRYLLKYSFVKQLKKNNSSPTAMYTSTIRSWPTLVFFYIKKRPKCFAKVSKNKSDCLYEYKLIASWLCLRFSSTTPAPKAMKTQTLDRHFLGHDYLLKCHLLSDLCKYYFQ